MSHQSSAAGNDYELVINAQQGDRNAFGELVRRHRAGVINLIYRLYGDSQLAEDAAQDAFVRAWQHLNQFKPKAAFRSWLYRIAANAAIDMLRQEKESLDIDTIQVPSRAMKPEAVLETAERSTKIQSAVLALPHASRVVLVLREYQGLSYRQISETLEIPLGTVMSRLNYARSLLRSELASLMEER
ncbi:MAG: sigma-70 family RNA polymerase sigma factor [Anaerolineae bacterium]|nr:sigma-70 family RNA polymerase sigma factor [Anaerolineae bacterium]